MNIDYVTKKAQEIKSICFDDEKAHRMEDDLRDEFIKFIVDNDYGELSEIAKEVLKTNEINFCRWCA